MAGNTRYKNQFLTENYDRIFLTVPKGTKALIEERAKAQNMSLNGYITSLIQKDMGVREKSRQTKSDMDVFLL